MGSIHLLEKQPMTRRALVACDPKTYRRQELELSAGWDESTDAELLGHYLANIVATLARRWRERYNVIMPLPRMEWSIEEATDAM